MNAYYSIKRGESFLNCIKYKGETIVTYDCDGHPTIVNELEDQKIQIPPFGGYPENGWVPFLEKHMINLSMEPKTY
jgi:hypothetical protein